MPQRKIAYLRLIKRLAWFRLGTEYSSVNSLSMTAPPKPRHVAWVDHSAPATLIHVRQSDRIQASGQFRSYDSVISSLLDFPLQSQRCRNQYPMPDHICSPTYPFRREILIWVPYTLPGKTITYTTQTWVPDVGRGNGPWTAKGRRNRTAVTKYILGLGGPVIG